MIYIYQLFIVPARPPHLPCRYQRTLITLMTRLTIILRPGEATVQRNRAFLKLTLKKTDSESTLHAMEDLLKLDNGHWNSGTITHHCGGVFCCRNIQDTRLKLWNAIAAP